MRSISVDREREREREAGGLEMRVSEWAQMCTHADSFEQVAEKARVARDEEMRADGNFLSRL